MGQVVFTTNFIVYEELLYRVYWLRYALSSVELNKSHKKILSNNRFFDVDFKPLHIAEETEQLYATYKLGIDFQAPESVDHFLNDGGIHNIYNSTMVEVRDNGKLIAVGVYDNGNRSMAGIMNFYHPDYKKYSLGKFLMLTKIQRAQQQNLEWYYPGYIVVNNPRFDYKLFIGKPIAEIFVPEINKWISYEKGQSLGLMNP